MNSSHPVSVGGILTALALVTLTACGGGGGGGSSTGTGGGTPPPATTYTIGGSVSGLTGSGLVLQDNGGDSLAVSQNGSFTFAKALNSGTAYAVTVATQPAGQSCTVSNGSGTASANVTNVAVSCTANAASFTIGGTVSGLSGTGLVLQDNSGDDLAVSANGVFTFKTALASGAAYAVTVKTQPSSPAQSCTVSQGSGTASANVTTVKVVCAGAVAQAVYAANNGEGSLVAFTVNAATGALSSAGTVTLGAGTAPAAVSLAPNGKFAYSAYSNGTQVAGYTIAANTGALQAISGSPFATGFVQGSPYPDIAVDPTSHFLYLASAKDNQVVAFSIDQSTGALTKVGLFAAGNGPAGIPVFSPNGKFLYVVDQGDSTVFGFSINSGTGALTAIGAAVAAGTTPNTQAMWISFTPDGKYAYVSNQNENKIFGFSVDATTGAFTAVGTPQITDTGPRDITIDPAGKHLYVANYSGGDVSGYTINADGTLTLIGSAATPLAAGANPIFVDIEPSGKFAYVSNAAAAGGIYAYSIDPSTGALTALTGSPFATGSKALFAIADASGKYLYTANNGSASISAFSIDATTGALAPVGTYPTSSNPGAQPFVVSINPEAPGIRD